MRQFLKGEIGFLAALIIFFNPSLVLKKGVSRICASYDGLQDDGKFISVFQQGLITNHGLTK